MIADISVNPAVFCKNQVIGRSNITISTLGTSRRAEKLSPGYRATDLGEAGGFKAARCMSAQIMPAGACISTSKMRFGGLGGKVNVCRPANRNALVL